MPTVHSSTAVIVVSMLRPSRLARHALHGAMVSGYLGDPDRVRLSLPCGTGDAGYGAAALTVALAGCRVHLLVRLPSGSVLDTAPVTWPGKHGRPGKPGVSVTCAGDPRQATRCKWLCAGCVPKQAALAAPVQVRCCLQAVCKTATLAASTPVLQNRPFCTRQLRSIECFRDAPNGGYLEPSLSTPSLTRTSAA